MRRLLRVEPAAVTGLVTAALAVAVSFGLGLDPGQIAAIVALIGASFAFLRGMVWPAHAVATIVADTAVSTAVALDHATAGVAGELTDAGQTVVNRVIKTVTGGRYSPLGQPASGEGRGGGREDGGIPLAALIALIVAFLVLAGGFAVCDAMIDDQDEPNDLGAPTAGYVEAGSRFDVQSLEGGRRGEPASGERPAIALPAQDDMAWTAPVGGHTAHHEDGDDYDQRYGNEGDQSRCRGRGCRGSFSPGPFDRSPIDFSGSCFSLDCSGHDGGRSRRDREPPRVESGEDPGRPAYGN